MTRNNTMVTMRKRSEFSSDSVIQDLTTLIKFKKGQQKNAQVLPETNLSLAMSSTAALIKYLDVRNCVSLEYKRMSENGKYLLDSSSMTILSIAADGRRRQSQRVHAETNRAVAIFASKYGSYQSLEY